MILYNPTVSGSLLVTGSLTTTGTITSQTLVVQTITSSIEFVTGSTRNGTLSTNTHEFTGSVSITGSAAALLNVNNGVLYVSASGNVGINNVSPTVALDVTGTARVTTSAYFATASGSVGIGTTSPTSYITGVLSIVATGDNYVNIVSPSANAAGVMFQDTTGVSIVGGIRYTHSDDVLSFWNAGSEKMRITSAGFVGINSTTPGAVLPSGNGWTSQPTKARVLQINSTDGFGNSGVFMRSAANTEGLDLWSDNWFGDAYIDSRWDNAAAKTYFRLRTAGTAITAMTLTTTGVGIGTSSPSSLLNTYSATTATQIIITGADTTNQRLEVTDGTVTNRFGIFGRTNGDVGTIGTQTNHSLVFNTNNTERMRITTAGVSVFGYTAAVGTNFSPPVQVKGGAGSGNGFGIISGNNEIAGGIQLASSSTNSINIAADPDNLRASSEIGFIIDNSQKMAITSGGNVGIGTSAPNSRLEVAGGRINITGTASDTLGGGQAAIYFDSTVTSGANYTMLQQGVNKFQIFTFNGSSWGERMSISSTGAVVIPGSLSKGSGSFRIKHPLISKKNTHQLVHSFIEGPQADLIYRGKIRLNAGKAIINIDEASTMTEGTFEALCREVQCFTTNETGWDAVKGKVTGNILTIESQNTESTDEISWMVVGERQDEHMIYTEWTDDEGKVIVEPLITE
jgi:hypothetical protein